MKLVSRDIKAWVVKVASVLLVPSFLALPAYAQLMLAHEGHHDAGGCSIKTGEFPVTFSAYEVPEGDLPPMHSFCENLPSPGKVNLTIELPHEARDIPLAIRVVKEGHGAHDAGKQGGGSSDQKKVDDKAHAEHEGMDHGSHVGDKHVDPTHGAMEHDNYYLAPMVHNSGIIVIATNLPERAKYNILLEKDDGSGNMKTVVSIPLNVGKGGGHGGHGGGFGMMEIILALLVVGGGGYYYFVYRKKMTQASA